MARRFHGVDVVPVSGLGRYLEASSDVLGSTGCSPSCARRCGSRSRPEGASAHVEAAQVLGARRSRRRRARRRRPTAPSRRSAAGPRRRRDRPRTRPPRCRRRCCVPSRRRPRAALAGAPSRGRTRPGRGRERPRAGRSVTSPRRMVLRRAHEGGDLLEVAADAVAHAVDDLGGLVDLGLRRGELLLDALDLAERAEGALAESGTASPSMPSAPPRRISTRARASA